MIKQPKSICS